MRAQAKCNEAGAETSGIYFRAGDTFKGIEFFKDKKDTMHTLSQKNNKENQ
ncbi:hypothetical protein [Helicobacter himalayensis]|uniref:hypothetical protein n=1 Tax=Helicobacter himalayensis TaxID=1591088 RepID=UPI003D6E2203